MKVMVIGSGGREHALCWALAQSPRVKEIVCAPGNGGMAQMARCLPVDQHNVDEMLALISRESPDLVIVGPELPLSLGLVDQLEQRGIRTFGPTQAAAMLETSKGYAKRFMQRHQIPTAGFAVCTTEQEAHAALDHFHLPVVIKADGLAAGKGVLICETKEEAKQAIAGLLSGQLLGSPEANIVVEEFLTGEEISFLVLSDGKHVSALVPAQDHKRVGEGDTGLNTGGMGTYTTPEMLDDQMRDWILHRIVQPTIDGMAAEDKPFRGVLYCGLMMTARGPMVLEYNTRFGDPETQSILMRLDSDISEALIACTEERLSETELKWRPGASACVIAASGGYPGGYKTGFPITGLEEAATLPGVAVFHAGTALSDGRIVTSGGRVLGVTAVGDDLKQALARAYEAIDKIHFEGMFFRRDIGHRALKAQA